MDVSTLFLDKTIKSKLKTEMLGASLLDKKLAPDVLIAFAVSAKEADKATCIEALEYATKKQSDLLGPEHFKFVCESLNASAPRVKWESAKVIGNTAQHFPQHLDLAISQLLPQTEHTGTVVRWSAAYALGEILKLNTSHNTSLLPLMDSICEREEQNSIRKIYLSAIKKTKG